MTHSHGEYQLRALPANRDELVRVAGLHHQVLPSRLYATLEQHDRFLSELMDALSDREHLVVGAFSADALVGYKLGYRTGNRNECFYSWLGGVHPHHRRKGLARAMSRFQHSWAAERGYVYVETHTWGDNAGMLILNLQEGFQAVGSLSAIDRPGARIIMRKILREI